MPCYTPPHQSCGHRNELDEKACDAVEAIQSLARTANYYKDKSDKATDMLCRLLNQPFGASIDSDILEWWEDHKKFDKARGNA